MKSFVVPPSGGSFIPNHPSSHPDFTSGHPERSEGSQRRSRVEIPRSARNDSWGSVILNAPSCHPERSEGSPHGSGVEILRSAQNDSRRSIPMDRLKAELRTGSLKVYKLETKRSQVKSNRIIAFRTSASILLLLLVPLSGGTLEATPRPIYLSDLVGEAEVKHSQGWGGLGIDTAAVPPDGRAATPIRIKEEVHEKGLGHHADGEIIFNLEGKYLSFEADVGVQWQGGNRGSVVFQVIVDGEKRFESSVMSDSDSLAHVSLDLTDARELRLIAGNAGDGIVCDMATWADARLLYDSTAPEFGASHLSFNNEFAPPCSASVCGFSLVAGETGPQVAFLGPLNTMVACIQDGEEIRVEIPVGNILKPFSLSVEAKLVSGKDIRVSLSLDGEEEFVRTLVGGSEHLEISSHAEDSDVLLNLTIYGGEGESTVRLSNAQLVIEGRTFKIPLTKETNTPSLPPLKQPSLRSSIERELIEWDWRMQDGIGTERAPVTYEAAIEKALQSGQDLLEDLLIEGVSLDAERVRWEEFHQALHRLRVAGVEHDSADWESLWKEVHWERRRIVFLNPLADTGPLLFVKQVPSSFSHQLTQYYGRCARPGGGVFVLDSPGRSTCCRCLTQGLLPQGSYQHADVSYDGKQVFFAYCHAETPPQRGVEGHRNRYYHLYAMASDGSGLRQLTDGSYDDFAPRQLPDGRIVFISTRRGGFHRCGGGGCEVYTLAAANADGSGVRTVSFHETQEWDPAVLNDGRVIYTRWDYVDRNAVHYQQLWTVRPDGSLPSIFYGNNTFSPVGVWEARSVPGSNKVMATAAAHHAMTAGSIILLDVNRGVDGLDPITRLTPDAPFPESETHVAPRSWHAPGSPNEPPPTPPEALRWPGHCYRSPYPLSEKYFLAAYSFDELIGEPDANPANMFGIYWLDCFGNKELLLSRPEHRLPVADASSSPVTASRSELCGSWRDGSPRRYFLLAECLRERSFIGTRFDQAAPCCAGSAQIHPKYQQSTSGFGERLSWKTGHRNGPR